MSWKRLRDGLANGELPTDDSLSFSIKSSVPRIEQPSQRFFIKRFVKGNKPVIITGAMDEWRAPSLWSNEYLSEHLSDINGEVIASTNGLYPDYQSKPVPMLKCDIPFEEFLQRVSNKNHKLPSLIGENETYYLYGKPYPFEKKPHLHKDIPTPGFIDSNSLTSTSLWMSSAGCVTPLHYDLINGLLCQIRGRKQVYLFSPEQIEHLYLRGNTFPGMDNNERQSQIDIHHPNWQQFPKFKNAAALKCILQPGDMLFIPSNWLHEVETLEMSISVGFSFSGGTTTSEMAAIADALKTPDNSSISMEQLQQQMFDNPEMIERLMKSPEFQSLLKDIPSAS